MITYMNLSTGEVTDSHYRAVHEFYNSGAEVALIRNGEIVATWVH